MAFWQRLKKKEQEIRNHKEEIKRQELFLQIRELLSKEFSIENKENIKPESRFIDDLGLDSVDAIQVIMALEREFSFEIPDEDAEKIYTVSEAVDYILTRLK